MPQLLAGGKQFIKTGLTATRTLDFACRLVKRRVVVLRYHSIADSPSKFEDVLLPGVVHSLSVFREQMELIACRYCPVNIDQVAGFLGGKMKMPPRAVAVTFDDGFADNFEIAAPVLNRLGIQALFYVIVDSIEGHRAPWFCRLLYAFRRVRKTEWPDSTAGRVHVLRTPEQRWSAFLVASERCARSSGRNQQTTLSRIEQELEVEPLRPEQCPMMSWDQLGYLQRAGHLVGSHSLTHPNLAYVDAHTQRREIFESKALLESRLGTEVRHFSYPNPIMSPNFNGDTLQLTKQAGYATAATVVAGPVSRGQEQHAIRRTSVPSTKDEFQWYVENTLLGRQL